MFLAWTRPDTASVPPDCARHQASLACRVMFSRRLPRHATANASSVLLGEARAAGDALIDLTEANPTRVGLGGAGPDELAALAAPEGARYEPDPRGSLPAREAVVGYYRERALAVSADDIVLTAGTSES